MQSECNQCLGTETLQYCTVLMFNANDFVMIRMTIVMITLLYCTVGVFEANEFAMIIVMTMSGSAIQILNILLMMMVSLVMVICINHNVCLCLQRTIILEIITDDQDDSDTNDNL